MRLLRRLLRILRSELRDMHRFVRCGIELREFVRFGLVQFWFVRLWIMRLWHLQQLRRLQLVC
jgi:hypothetical protein